MQDRPAPSYDLPKYAILYFADGEWKQSPAKFTIPDAEKRYGEYKWEIVPEPEEDCNPDAMPGFQRNSPARLRRGG